MLNEHEPLTWFERLSAKLDDLGWWWRQRLDGTDPAWDVAYKKHGGHKRPKKYSKADEDLARRTRQKDARIHAAMKSAAQTVERAHADPAPVVQIRRGQR